MTMSKVIHISTHHKAELSAVEDKVKNLEIFHGQLADRVKAKLDTIEEIKDRIAHHWKEKEKFEGEIATYDKERIEI